MNASNVTDMLFKQLNFRGENQKIISRNIANIDTPNYKTKELSFENELKLSSTSNELRLYRTHPGHMSIAEPKMERGLRVKETQGLEEQNDGNNVNLDAQMSAMAKNSIMFSAIQSSIKKDSAWFKSVIDASSKN